MDKFRNYGCVGARQTDLDVLHDLVSSLSVSLLLPVTVDPSTKTDQNERFLVWTGCMGYMDDQTTWFDNWYYF